MSYSSSATPKATRRKLDPKRPITVYRAGEVSDADAQPVSLDVGTGVEKEEEKEVHLQAYIQTYAATAATVDIPVPDATQTISDEEYVKLYPPRPASGAGAAGSAGSSGRSTPSMSRPPSRSGSTGAMAGGAAAVAGATSAPYTTLPTTLIRFSAALEDLPCGNAYNLDEQDDSWLASFRDTYAVEYPKIVAEVYPSSGSSSTAAESAVTSSGGQDGSPPRKRARRGTSSSPHKSASKDDASASGDQKPPPLVPLSDDAFEVVMHVLESAMNDQVSWMLTNPGYDSQLAIAERITVAEALAALRSRPDLVGPQPLGGMSSSSSYPLAMNSMLGTPRHTASTLTYPSLANTPMVRTSDLPGMPPSSSQAQSHYSPSSSSSPPKALPPHPNDPPASQVEWWLPHVHPWWSERRARCNNRPISPLVRIEEPVSKNEADPYVCFRRREVKVVRKTRRSDVTALASLKKLRGELASARVLVGLVHDREVACLDKVRVDRAVFNARVKLRAVKKQAAGVASATGLPEAEMEFPEFALPIVPPLPPALQGAVKSAQAQKAAAAGGPSSASSTPLTNSIPLPGAGAGVATSSSASSRKRDHHHHHHHHHHSSSSARATPSATPSGPSALSRSASASALSAANEGPMQVGPRPFTVQKVLSVDIKGMPSVGEVQQAKIEREIKDRLTASAQGVDVSQAPQAIFHPLPTVRVPGGSGGKSVPTSAAAAAAASADAQQQQPPVPSMAIPPLAWRAFTPRLPPSYMSPAGTYHGFSHQHHAAATAAAAAAAATSGGKASPYQSMFVSAMANGMYHPGLASAAAAARGIAPGSMYHPHAPVTPPGTPPVAGFMSGQHAPPNHPHLNSNAPGAWLAHVPPELRRQLLYPYAAAAAAAAAAASMAAANASASASGLDQSTFKHVPHRLRHPRVDGGLDVAGGGSSSSASATPAAAKDSDGDTIMSEAQPVSALSSSRPSTALSHPGAMSTPSPSPDIVTVPTGSRSQHASPSDIRSHGMPSSDGPAPPSPTSSPTCLPASSPPEASLKSVPSLGLPARTDAPAVSLELSQQHHPIPLSPASVASEPASHGPPSTNSLGEPASPLPAPPVKSAPWLAVPPAKVFASLFDRDSPMSAQLVSSAMSLGSAAIAGEDMMDLDIVDDVERTPTQASVGVGKLSDPLLPASPTPVLPPQASQWAFRRRVGRVGRAVVERRWVPPAGASASGGKVTGPAAAAGKRHPSAR